MTPARRIGRTVRKVMILLLILAASLVPAVYVGSIYGYLPFLGLLFLLLLSFIYLLAVRRAVHFEMETADAVCQRGEKVSVSLKIVNTSILLCPKARAYLFVSDFFGGNDTVTPMTFTMNGKSSSEFSFDVRMNHIGLYEAGVKTLQIGDLLGIFSFSVPGGKAFSVTVLPRLYLNEVKLEDKLLAESKAFLNSTQNDGYDYTGVREYAFGDSMKRIHWKLSAHSSGYMTKITETCRKSDMTVVIDFAAPKLRRDMVPGIYDCLVETGLSFIEQALTKDVEYSLLFSGHNCEITRVIPKGIADYENLVHVLPRLSDDPGQDMLDAFGILEKEKQVSNRSSNIIICSSRITEELIQELIAVKTATEKSDVVLRRAVRSEQP